MNHTPKLESPKTVGTFLCDEEGQAMTEYILLVGLIVIPIAIAFNLIRSPLRGYLDRIVRLFTGPGI